MCEYCTHWKTEWSLEELLTFMRLGSHNIWCEKGQQQMAGFECDGFFQEFATVDARNAMVLPEGVLPTEAAPLFCAGVTAFHAIDELGLQPGKWVGIIGCGGLGHLGIRSRVMPIIDQADSFH